MFEKAEMGKKLSKADYQKIEPELRTELLNTQLQIVRENIPVVIILAGLDFAGKGDFINQLSEWLDQRHILFPTFWTPSDEEQERPPYWKYWNKFPKKGQMALIYGAWYSGPIFINADKEMDEAAYEKELGRIVRFERMHVQDGTLIIKFWFHISQEEQEKRLAQNLKKPKVGMKVTKREKKHVKMYKEITESASKAIQISNTAEAPWIIVDAKDVRNRDVTAANYILEAMKTAIEQKKNKVQEKQLIATAFSRDYKQSILDTVDLESNISDEDYKIELKKYQKLAGELTWEAYNKKISTICVFEGWDAGGKGGSIRRLTKGLDARLYNVRSVAAPNDLERAYHYLWRFWMHLPRAGFVTIYDRSWYGRVLVERVEGFATENEWSRSYREINFFENQLVEHGIVVLKYWLHIDKDEQLRRFKEREQIPWKKHKITEEDYRNREKWDDYESAVDDMVSSTSTVDAPWYLIPANNKKFARIEVLKKFCERLKSALK